MTARSNNAPDGVGASLSESSRATLSTAQTYQHQHGATMPNLAASDLTQQLVVDLAPPSGAGAAHVGLSQLQQGECPELGCGTLKDQGKADYAECASNSASDQSALIVGIGDTEPRADTRILAQHLGLQHHSVVKLVNDYRADFEALGVVRFQIHKSTAKTGGRPTRFALLSEDQSYLLLTYSRNNDRVRGLKVRLVKAFGELRRNRNLWRTEYLPTYHSLHDEIASLAHGSPNEHFVHMNVNKLVNGVVGIGAGRRRNLDLAQHSMLIVAQATATASMHGAADHHEGYAKAKDALAKLGKALTGGTA